MSRVALSLFKHQHVWCVLMLTVLLFIKLILIYRRKCSLVIMSNESSQWWALWLWIMVNKNWQDRVGISRSNVSWSGLRNTLFRVVREIVGELWILQVTGLVERINRIILDDIKKKGEVKISARRENKFGKMSVSPERFYLVISIIGRSRLNSLYYDCLAGCCSSTTLV